MHPDDPPRDILGLPRIVSDAGDIAWLLGAVDNPANGLTLCAGSLGANPKNDVPATARRFADRIHFAHLRNARKDAGGLFKEAAHLTGDTDMVDLVAALLQEERRRDAGVTNCEIPFRPDHLHELLDNAGRNTHPGYPSTGRMHWIILNNNLGPALVHFLPLAGLEAWRIWKTNSGGAAPALAATDP